MTSSTISCPRMQSDMLVCIKVHFLVVSYTIYGKETELHRKEKYARISKKLIRNQNKELPVTTVPCNYMMVDVHYIFSTCML